MEEVKDIESKLLVDSEFVTLVRERSRFVWTLTFVLLFAYFAYIFVIAFKPSIFAQSLRLTGVFNWGIFAAISIMLLSFLLTGIYVVRTNYYFDSKMRNIISRLSRSVPDSSDIKNS